MSPIVGDIFVGVPGHYSDGSTLRSYTHTTP